MAFVLRVIINGVALWLATLIVPGAEMLGGDPTESPDWKRIGIFLLVGLIFGLVNALIKPLVRVLALPLYILTLGLFTLVANALLLMLVAWITEHTDWGLRLDNFGTAVLAALVISIASFVMSVLVGRRDRRHH